MKNKTRSAPPRAMAMLESLRGLGYSTGAALADIIDNSISAGASEVRLDFSWDGQGSRITVLDNGLGMSDAELESAMRLGDKNPLDTRTTHDLGRFGMGLKTASFSQCRRLTVASVKDGTTSCLRWDLDELAANPDGGWLLFEGPAQGSKPFISGLNGKKAGTVVLWEQMDRIVTDGFTSNDFHDLIDTVESHLAMVFHRLLQGPRAKLMLLLNGRSVAPWDPFMTGHPSKPWTSPPTNHSTDYGIVTVQAHVLPHRDRLTAAEFDSNAGPAGWTAQQGFYVYRNERLLVAGGWLGLGNSRAWNREEAHRLARIRLDIPNTADADWKIDVRKSTARPPVSLRPWLTLLAENSYNTLLAREGNTAAKLRDLKDAIPASRRITKTDLAKYITAWDCKPDIVSQGSQKNFDKFMATLTPSEGQEAPLPTAVDFKAMIAKAKIYRDAQKLLRPMFPAFQANVTAYTVSLVAQKLGDRIDLGRVWVKQAASPELLSQIAVWAKEVNDVLHSSSGGKMISEWAKRPECREAVMSASYSAPAANIPEVK
jgi:hypothetical protein